MDSMLGRFWATCGADEQADFLNVAGKDMRRHCGDSAKLDMQCCYIVDKLDGAGRDLIKRLAEFIALDESTPQVVKRVIYEDEVRPRSEEPKAPESDIAP